MKKSAMKTLFFNRVGAMVMILLGMAVPMMKAEDGSSLWLRLNPEYGGKVIADMKSTPTLEIAKDEVRRYWKGAPVRFRIDKKGRLRDEGFSIDIDDEEVKITSPSEIGLLYGVYHLLRIQPTMGATIVENPVYSRRILNHWDNPDGTVERGYAGSSLWEWDSLPSTISSRYAGYARANASIGINGTVINNVNAKAEALSAEYLCKTKVLADVFRPYGIKVYLAINFDSPKRLGGLPTSDPFDKDVKRWWRDKAKEIYSLIPDFGGFLVKANSEGTAGPLDYGRSHADGANMLADALKPYGGIVMWRAFVYHPEEPDRAKQAYSEFKPLDGQFHDNVILQVKNGPIDFQPREPYTPLFGSMSATKLMVEFQITQEYLGHANHLAYLAPMWKEFFEYVSPSSITSVAGVANIGNDGNWCGYDMAQANWYAFGRLAWNPELSAEEIADEWLSQTFTPDTAFVNPMKEMMMQSREAVVNYMMPLGLHHIFAKDHHYGPQPWFFDPALRVDWTATHYHKADSDGLGFDRSSTGSDAVSQYPEDLAALFDDINRCPEEYLLWFHHVGWNHKMRNGRSLWDELCHRYDTGVQEVRRFQKIWDCMEPFVDTERFAAIQDKLKIQARDAVWWKDACLLYFQQFSCQPIPYDVERPVHNLQDMMEFRLNMGIHGNAPHGFNK